VLTWEMCSLEKVSWETTKERRLRPNACTLVSQDGFRREPSSARKEKKKEKRKGQANYGEVFKSVGEGRWMTLREKKSKTPRQKEKRRVKGE